MILSADFTVHCCLFLFCLDCDGGAQDEFDDYDVEPAQQLLWQTQLLHLLQKVYPLLGLSEDLS